LGKWKINKNSNYQHYNILSASEVKDETSTYSTYVRLVFYCMVRSKKILAKKYLHVLFSEGVVLSGFAPKYHGYLGVINVDIVKLSNEIKEK
jgi:hypothetical protein